MAGRILYFGEDSCYRITVLRAAGYAVEQCRSILQLLAALDDEGNAQTVVVTEEALSAEFFALARCGCLGPLVLFRSSFRALNETNFALVIPVVHRPADWLAGLRSVIEKGHAASAALGAEEMLRYRSTYGTAGIMGAAGASA